MTKEQNTGFGATVALVLLITGRLSGTEMNSWSIAVLLVTALCPRLFTPLSAVWYMLGRRLECLFSTVILFLVYFLVVTPVGLLRCLFAKDALSIRRFGKGCESVFSVREKEFCAGDLEHPY